jgi:hypothetical protein
LGFKASIASVKGPSWLHFEHPQPLNFEIYVEGDPIFDFDADSDPAFYSGADRNLDPRPKIMRMHAFPFPPI